ncbi:F-box protein At5g07610-like [Impatiens glandulifera]|uniref:F-box protein At5g07610-like n=1 Tax=Impatiens glandulifera TaxID=253017 RepID=UPI001FB08C36|nr:F-box protein At5g07610-like [Impatiens glandulifera]
MAEEPISSIMINTNDDFISISSADKVASNQDLLLEILLRLPIKSLMRFKSVSKQWQSVISDRRFTRRWRPTSSPSGLFFHWFSNVYVSLPHIDFIPLDNNMNSSTYPNLEFFPYLYGITFMNSTNGLICCVVCSKLKPRVSYHVINPSTRQFTTLPQPSLSHLQLEGLTMAFEPTKSPHYKLVSVRSSNIDSSSTTTTHYQLEIYSSETRSWNASIETFTTPERHPNFHRGVYWNGAIVWFVSSGDSVFFQIEEERMSTNIPALTFEVGFWYDREFCVGESNGHLYLVETYMPKTWVKVYEMESDFSGWVMKYNINLFEVGKAFPLMLKRLPGRTSPFSFEILSLVWGEDHDRVSIGEGKTAPFLVVTIPEKMIRVNLEVEEDEEKNSFMAMCDVDIEFCEREEVYHECTRYFSADSHKYIETLFTTSP